MGICQSQEEKESESKTKQIDKDLLQAHIAHQKIVKLLLLGAGECGKSTILKQMSFAFSVLAMATLLHGMSKLNISFENKGLESAARIVLDIVRKGEESEPYTDELVHAIKALWADKNIKEKVLPRGQEFQLVENSKYFLDAIDRTSNPDYRPTEQDILLSRIKTTGIIEVNFD
uniref:Uncharacterized protein n=1 Tax=Meloidogyne floridensis TaxID=298350 RepID=A0A915NAQ7_9BILA